MGVIEFENPLLKSAGDQPCCRAFKPTHSPDCQAYNDNFDKTINMLKALPKRSATVQEIAKHLGSTHEIAYDVVQKLHTAGALIKDRMRYALAAPKNQQPRPPVNFPGISEADDKCEACGINTANRECSHGMLCDECDEQVHGSVGGECKVGAAEYVPQKYPDTAEGAIACLKADSSLNVTGATARPDPSVQGVWEVRMPDGTRAIVYLAGYKDPSGKPRADNDFEVDDSKTASPDRSIIAVAGTEWVRGRKATKLPTTFYITAVSFNESSWRIKSFTYSKQRSKAQQFSKLMAEKISMQLNGPLFRAKAQVEKA